jgi:hypothetical protein
MSGKTAALYEPGYMVAGKYELESLLGQGGMGAVWRARNIALDASVAIKVVRASGDKAQLRSRLMQEARAAAKLTHPAIVKMFDVGQTEAGDPFIVMELLHGDSLGKLLQTDKRLSATQAVRLLLPICDALWLAHGKGIVHRDLKPDNVFIVQHEGAIQPTLVDFGIVKIQESEHDSNLTKDGDVLGSPDYMSPEQARGSDDVNHLTDVWSFSVVLYEAIAGHTPFKGSNYNALLRQIVEDTPRSLQEESVADAELSAIVARGLSKRPEQRFASMGELGRALASWLMGQGVTEDICGTTLEAKWLRSGDAQGRPGRATLASITDAWPSSEKGSGVRRNAGGPGSTIPATKDVRPNRRPNRLALGLLAVVALCAGAGLTFALARGHSAPTASSEQPSPPKADSASRGAAVGAPAAAPEAPSAVAAPEAPSGAADEGAAQAAAQAPAEPVSSTSGRAPSGATQGKKLAAPARPARRPRPGKVKTKPGDLMRPY